MRIDPAMPAAMPRHHGALHAAIATQAIVNALSTTTAGVDASLKFISKPFQFGISSGDGNSPAKSFRNIKSRYAEMSLGPTNAIDASASPAAVVANPANIRLRRPSNIAGPIKRSRWYL